MHAPQHKGGINSGDPIVGHDAPAAVERFGLPCGERLPDIEYSKKYKAEQQKFPITASRSNRPKSQVRYALARNFIDHNNLWIVLLEVPRCAMRYPHADDHHEYGQHQLVIEKNAARNRSSPGTACDRRREFNVYVAPTKQPGQADSHE